MNLKDPASRAQYVSECLGMVNNVNNLDQLGVQTGLIKAVNRQLKLAGVPKVISAQDSNSQANAVFDFQNWRITFGAPMMATGSLETLKLGVNTVYHEARHCEQWFRMAQGVAAGKLNKSIQQRITSLDAASIAGAMWIPQAVAQTAIADTDYGGNPDRDVKAWWDSVYASSGGIRGKKLAHINARYDAYRNLPEEVDAWYLGDTVESDFIVQCPKLGCPSYDYWKKKTSIWYLSRSKALKDVDGALKAYDKSKSADDRKDLKSAFDKWYALKEQKGGSVRAQGVDNPVDQLKDFLDQYNDQGTQGVNILGGKNTELLAALAKRK
jgi:hypothetical protein